MTTSDYIPTIGLEIHAELKTATKMFCDSPNDPHHAPAPNVYICPVCLGHPGTLPVINKEAVRHVLKVGVAVGGSLATYTEFDRKNYFYPDIPKGYQISQYAYPLVSGGELNGVELTRIHLEEDTARSVHDQGDYSLIDFNRAGVPLMELVTEPVIHSAEESADFARELQLLLQYIGASDANMEKGELRLEANISVSPDAKNLGTKVEIKNLNSFRSVERAITYEIKRHIQALESGESVIQETRGWDESAQKTTSQRRKEEAHDYRYFPDPDLPSLDILSVSDFSKTSLRDSFAELPHERRARYQDNFDLSRDDADMYVRDRSLGDFFDAVSDVLDGKAYITKASHMIQTELAQYRTDDFEYPDPKKFAVVVTKFCDGEISSRGMKELLQLFLETGEDPDSLAEKHNLLQESDEEALEELVLRIIENHPDQVNEFRNGREQILQFFVGQAMKETKGSANPQIVQKLFRTHLTSQ